MAQLIKTEEIPPRAETWYSGARLFPRIGLSKVESKHPLLSHYVNSTEATQRWYDACTTAYVLCAIRSSAQLLDPLDSATACQELLRLYMADYADGYLLVNATLITERWLLEMQTHSAYGLWVASTLAQSSTPERRGDDFIDLTVTLGAMITNFAEEWWTK